jgi:hypothetical protein
MAQTGSGLSRPTLSPDVLTRSLGPRRPPSPGRLLPSSSGRAPARAPWRLQGHAGRRHLATPSPRRQSAPRSAVQTTAVRESARSHRHRRSRASRRHWDRLLGGGPDDESTRRRLARFPRKGRHHAGGDEMLVGAETRLPESRVTSARIVMAVRQRRILLDPTCGSCPERAWRGRWSDGSSLMRPSADARCPRWRACTRVPREPGVDAKSVASLHGWSLDPGGPCGGVG